MLSTAILFAKILRKVIVPTYQYTGERNASRNGETIGNCDIASTENSSTKTKTATNGLVTSKSWDIPMQSAKVMINQDEAAKEEEELDMLKRKTSILQLKLRRERTQKQKMKHALIKKQEIIDKLKEDITTHETNITKLTDQLRQQSVELLKFQIRSQHQVEEREILLKEMQNIKEDMSVSARSKVSGFLRKRFLPKKLTNTPRPPVAMDKTEKEEGEEALEGHQAGVRLSELELLASKNHVVMSSIEKLPPRPSVIKRQPPVSREEWESFRDASGSISAANQDQFLARVFYGGINPDIRAETWKYLLDYMPFDKTNGDREILRQEKEEEYNSMKKQWKAFSEVQLQRFQLFEEHRELIHKDVYRTDREVDKYKSSSSHSLTQLEDILTTYLIYNMNLGYAQGMSDMLAPILYVVDNEVDTFWCFAGLMERMMGIFKCNQDHAKERVKKLRTLVMLFCPNLYHLFVQHGAEDLFFCFRWLLVSFKREFNYEDVMRIWEVIWTNRLSTDHTLFIALAILDNEADNICHHANENGICGIVDYINKLEYTMDVDKILELAECYIHQLSQHEKLPDEIKSIIKDPLPGRQKLVKTSTDELYQLYV